MDGVERVHRSLPTLSPLHVRYYEETRKGMLSAKQNFAIE
jgi:hypothetical protein